MTFRYISLCMFIVGICYSKVNDHRNRVSYFTRSNTLKTELYFKTPKPSVHDHAHERKNWGKTRIFASEEFEQEQRKERRAAFVAGIQHRMNRKKAER